MLQLSVIIVANIKNIDTDVTIQFDSQALDSVWFQSQFDSILINLDMYQVHTGEQKKILKQIFFSDLLLIIIIAINTQKLINI